MTWDSRMPQLPVASTKQQEIDISKPTATPIISTNLESGSLSARIGLNIVDIYHVIRQSIAVFEHLIALRTLLVYISDMLQKIITSAECPIAS